jgi:hypothetical protein
VYKNWKTQAIKQDIFKKFSKFIEDDEYLKDKVCIISGGLIANPSQTKCNHVFETSDLKTWLNKDGRNGIGPCPLCNREIKISELQESDMYLLGICQRILKLRFIINDELILKGMNAYIKAQSIDQFNVVQAKLDINAQNYNVLNRITLQEFTQEKAKLDLCQSYWASWKDGF